MNSYKSYYFLHNKKKNNALEFLSSMDKNIFNKTIEQMKLVNRYGIDIEHCNIKKFQNGIWKIRTKDHSNNVRLFFYIIDNNIYYLYGFMKKTQKTPEGKKITINNLKTELMEAIKNNKIDDYVELIKF